MRNNAAHRRHHGLAGHAVLQRLIGSQGSCTQFCQRHGHGNTLGIAVLVHPATLASLCPPLHAFCCEVCRHHKWRSLSGECRLSALIMPVWQLMLDMIFQLLMRKAACLIQLFQYTKEWSR